MNQTWAWVAVPKSGSPAELEVVLQSRPGSGEGEADGGRATFGIGYPEKGIGRTVIVTFFLILSLIEERKITIRSRWAVVAHSHSRSINGKRNGSKSISP
jgi:hypothetical protein